MKIWEQDILLFFLQRDKNQRIKKRYTAHKIYLCDVFIDLACVQHVSLRPNHSKTFPAALKLHSVGLLCTKHFIFGAHKCTKCVHTEKCAKMCIQNECGKLHFTNLSTSEMAVQDKNDLATRFCNMRHYVYVDYYQIATIRSVCWVCLNVSVLANVRVCSPATAAHFNQASVLWCAFGFCVINVRRYAVEHSSALDMWPDPWQVVKYNVLDGATLFTRVHLHNKCT